TGPPQVWVLAYTYRTARDGEREQPAGLPARAVPRAAGSPREIYVGAACSTNPSPRPGTCAVRRPARCDPHPVRESSAGMLRLRALAALAALVAAGGGALAGPDEGAVPAAPDLAGHGEAAPAERKLKLRVGDHIDFAAPAGAGERAQWTLDGAAAGSGAAWTFAPTASDVGPHVVSVAGIDGSGRTILPWDVRVTPPRLP